MNPSLPAKSQYSIKDQAKSDRATCFIGRGSPRSSTHAYMLAWGQRANISFYRPEDTAFVSAEGDRVGRLEPDFVELSLACRAGITFITDVPHHRARDFNVGERQVAQFLVSRDYHEIAPGVWEPMTEHGTIRKWMEVFDTWAQCKTEEQIIAGLEKKGFKPYFLKDMPSISREPGINLVDPGDHLHIPYVMDHKVVWGPNGMVAFTSAGDIIHAVHSI